MDDYSFSNGFRDSLKAWILGWITSVIFNQIEDYLRYSLKLTITHNKLENNDIEIKVNLENGFSILKSASTIIKGLTFNPKQQDLWDKDEIR